MKNNENKQENVEKDTMAEIDDRLKKADSMINSLSNLALKEALTKELAEKLAIELAKIVTGIVPAKSNVQSPLTSKQTRSVDYIKFRGIPAEKKDEYLEFENSIDRTSYPEIQELESSLDKSLFILKIAADKGHEWMGPAEVHKILFNLFKQSIERAAIKMALSRATLYAQRRKEGKNVSYRLADSGEKYIAKKISEIHERKSVGASNTTEEEIGK